ncbi:MAG: hypothetical protein ACRECH_12210, partial [Nitrososphaerales archaeon]
ALSIEPKMPSKAALGCHERPDWTSLVNVIDCSKAILRMPSLGENKVNWVEFKTLKDLFTFVITKSIPGQQFVSLLKYKSHVYTYSPLDEGVMVFFTKEVPKSGIYVWDADKDDFMPMPKADRTRINILVQEVAEDTLVRSVFYK